jgi:signal transduction histidine kinase
MLKQVFFSLLANAIRFSPAGGTVDVTSAQEGEQLIITIADMGTGIRNEDIPNLFDAFTPLESVYTPKSEGSGLCLALTRQLVELHGGTIRVESEFGTGSRFSISIPLKNC